MRGHSRPFRSRVRLPHVSNHTKETCRDISTVIMLHMVPSLLRASFLGPSARMNPRFPRRANSWQVHGTSAGGDADELRLLSDEDTVINLRAYGGSLSFLDTKVGIRDSKRCLPDTLPMHAVVALGWQMKARPCADG